MPRGIFISYRRDDTSGFAGRLFDRLVQNFPREQLFIDVDGIEPGANFANVLTERVGECEVLLALIGPRWLSRDGTNERPRLSDPKDFVRIEIAAALQRDVRVIPLLIEGARMPTIEELPEPIQGLAQRQAVEISHKRFDLDMEALVQTLRRLAKAPPQSPSADAAADRKKPNANRFSDAGVASPVVPDKPSIAVLPFTNMSGDPEQEYFADGISEDLITGLSKLRWFFVIARNSSFSYKGKSVDIKNVARELGVRYVLEGSVRKGGNNVRITAQLIDAATNNHIWADRYDGVLTDIFTLQDQITESVIAAIEPSVQLAEIERLKRKPAANLDAYDLLLRAQQLEYEFTDESLRAALDCLNQALALDSSYTPAMALTGYCHAERRVQGWMQNPEMEVAEGLRLALRAIELGKDDSNILWMAAWAIRHLANDGPRSRELAARSLLLNPNSAIALAIAGWTEGAADNPVKALELFRRAERLSPRDPKGWFIATGMAHAHFLAGQFDEAVSCAKRALAQNPRFAIALRFLAASLAKLGQKVPASEIVQALVKNEPQLTLTLLRRRLMFMNESAWEKFSDGLRLAGMPE